MTEITKRHRFFATLLLIFMLAMNTSLAQLTREELPRGVNPFMGGSHSIIGNDKEILDYDFSCILADNRVDFIGYLGKDYQRMHISFNSVKTESSMRYRILGASRIKGGSTPFSGYLNIMDIRELNQYKYGIDDCMVGMVTKQGFCIASYKSEQEGDKDTNGVFVGMAIFRWYVDKNGDLCYDDINDFSDSYSNNQFYGVLNIDSHSVECGWGHYRIPVCGDLDIGAAKFSVNPKYAANGWDKEETD